VNRTVVIGLGNILMSDEGVGVHVVRNLAARAGDRADVEFLDLGVAGPTVLHAIAGRPKAVFVDCAYMNEEPGAIRRFSPAEVRSVKAQPRLALHGGDLLASIELSRRLEECPPEITIFGIEPAFVSPGECLSEALEARMDEYEKLVLAELA